MKISPQSLLTRSLRESPRGEKAARIMAASLDAVDPVRLVRRRLAREGSTLTFQNDLFDLGEYSRIYLLAVGKAALPMGLSAGELLGGFLTKGFILSKTGNPALPDSLADRVTFHRGGHPVPTEDGAYATSRILQELQSLEENDLLITLISGGSSALFCLPPEGISLSDLQLTNQILLGCGADILEINTIRKHLSRVKGGQLTRIVQPARVFTLILSDVMGSQIDMIGSGPTAPDPSTFSGALAVVEKYNLGDELPAAVLDRLKAGSEGELAETPKPGDPCFKKVSNHILAENRDALLAGAAQAEREGFNTVILPAPMAGEASRTGLEMAEKLLAAARKDGSPGRPTCLLAGGETTVNLGSGKPVGLGGRNLELALSTLPELDGLEDCALIALATDGEDGMTNAAGAVVTGQSASRCHEIDLDPADFLRRHDSYTLFKALDDLLLPGPTGTNVNDLCFLFAF